MITDKRLKEIQDALAAATPGPWKGTMGWVTGSCIGGCRMEEGDFKICDIRGWGHLQYLGEEKAIKIQDANRDLIANTPTYLAELLAEIKTLTKGQK